MGLRALQFDGRQPVLTHDAPEPVMGPGEALIRPTRVGISAADLAICRGEGGHTGTLGHEFVGIVERVNPGQDTSAALTERAKGLMGKRVVGSIGIICGKCDLCRAGLSSHCRKRAALGMGGRDGCFTDRFTLPLGNLHLVPEGVDDERAAFAEPLASAVHAAAMLKIEGKPYITVLGDGTLGLLTAQVMARLNASVRLLGKDPAKFELCDHWGIKHRHVDEVGRLADQDVVVDCTGSPSGLVLAMQLVRPRGKIILKSTSSLVPRTPGAAAASDPQPAGSHGVDLSPLVIGEIELIGSRGGSIPEALALLEKNLVSVEPLITLRSRLEDGVAALEAARRGQIKVLMAV